VKRLLVSIALLLLAGCARPLPPGVTELIYATPYPPSHPFSRADQRWMDYVAERSGGKLRIVPIWSGALLSSNMSMEELRHGVADIGLVTPIYARGATHLIRIQSGFYSGADEVESQVALYRCIEARVPEIANELQGLKVLAVQGGLLPGLATRERPVRSLADIKGLRIRAPTELLSVLRGLGADPVNMPMGDVYSALAKGVIDGVVAPIDTFKVLHFADVTKYYSTLRVPRGAYPSRAMGIRKWNRLSPADRQVLTDSIPVWEAALADEIRRGGRAGAEAAQAGDIRISPMPERDQQAFDALYLQDAERNARGLADWGIDGLAAFRVARSSIGGRDQIKCGDSV
jgi:TRAP-type C4-dicarboxylate transport system substrate-binding protein